VNKIEKNIPLPRNKTKPNKYPFSDMEIGDSFYTEGASVMSAACIHAKRKGGKFLCRKQGNGTRVWRTA